MAPTDIQNELSCLARELRPVGKPFISLVQLAHELGTIVSLRLYTTPGSPTAQIDLRNRPPKIILYRHSKVNGEREIQREDEGSLTPRERFSIAHELGHWVVFSRFRIGPQSDNRTYWLQEQAINAFAGCLLVPDWLVANWLEGSPPNRPVSPFALRYWAISQCRSSEEVVAKALARHRNSIGFLKLLPTTRRKDGTNVLQVLCSAAGDALRLPNERSHIDSPELFALLRANRVGSATLPQLRLGRCEPQDLRIAWRRGKRLGSADIIWLSLAIEDEDGSLTDASQIQLRIQSPASMK
jgi:hypothetical protein